MPRFLIVGGSDAGISGALRAREVDPSWEVTLLVRDRYPNYSICGLPFYISGEVDDWRDLAHRKAADIEAQGIELLLEHTAEAVDASGHTVAARATSGEAIELRYDKLLIGTGAESRAPTIPGLDEEGVFPLRWMDDSLAVRRFIEEREPETALVVGGGYIGMELADALTHRGLRVTVLDRNPTVLKTVEAPLGELLAGKLADHGVTVVTRSQVQRIERRGGALAVESSTGELSADLVVVVTGVAPNGALAGAAGAERGPRGAIRVSRRMETNLPDVYAAGDCVQTWHRLLGRYMYLPLGTTAHKQGRVAGHNAVSSGPPEVYAGSLGTQVVKVFDLVAARSGLLTAEAREAGHDPLTVPFTCWDHKVYYPGASEMHLRLTGDRGTGQLLGGQILGHRCAEVSKRVDVLAAALFHGMGVEELNHLDLSYTPPLSSPWDPVQMAAQAWAVERGD